MSKNHNSSGMDMMVGIKIQWPKAWLRTPSHTWETAMPSDKDAQLTKGLLTI